MRIVHISDIHLSDKNFYDFNFEYRDALLRVLANIHSEKKIDIIAITGDLVDKGGHSLLEMPEFKGKFNDPYEIFELEFINPIMKLLELESKNFLFIPGNHDIDENEVLMVDERALESVEQKGEINSILDHTRDESVKKYNGRIKAFKDFEERFHKEDIKNSYKFTRNQSTYIYDYEGLKIGFALINDSWRCSSWLGKYRDKKLYFGSKQLKEALKLLKDTTMNVILTHHPIDSYQEEEEVREIITRKDFHLHLYGDQHHHSLQQLTSASSGCFGIMARAALNNPREAESKWQPGFHFIDIDFENNQVELIKYYKFFSTRAEFDTDNDIAAGGRDESKHRLSFDPVKKETAQVEENNDDDETLENYYNP